ncbi:hypothetical protein SERN_0750 [Serinibacter arcticus]|uniref:Uncharacterized protein n=1 Tax=Serinibacter arcticus TaxID=1655435 RepID=A0A4Z1E6S0_9MICO|nr:hypothetical protein SERN_0750 [Serinibacter arcticus]
MLPDGGAPAAGGLVPGGAGPARAVATASPTGVGTRATTTASPPVSEHDTSVAPARSTAVAAAAHGSVPDGRAAALAALIAPRSPAA